MSLTDKIMSRMGYIKKIKEDDGFCEGGDVLIQDGKVVGTPYHDFSTNHSLIDISYYFTSFILLLIIEPFFCSNSTLPPNLNVSPLPFLSNEKALGIFSILIDLGE